MEMLSIVPLGASAVYFILLLVIIFSRRWEIQHRLFASFLAAACIWTFSVAFLRSDLLLDQKDWFFRIALFFSVAWVVQLYHFMRSFLKLPPGFGVWFGYASMLAFGLLLLLTDVRAYYNVQDGMLSYNYGWWFLIFAAPLVVLAMLAIYTMAHRFINLVEPEARNKLSYLLMAVSVVAIFGLTGITPLAKGLPISHLGGLLSALILTYAIVKHELVSVNLILRRGIAWAGLIAVGIGGFLGLFFIASLLFDLEDVAANLTVTTIAGVAIALSIFSLRNIFIRWVDQFFFKKSYDYHQELSTFIRRGIGHVFGLRELSQKLLPPLVKTLRCQDAYILLPRTGDGDFVAEYAEPAMPENKPPFVLRHDSPIVSWLTQENRYLAKETMDILPEFRGLWTEERNELRSFGIEMLFPMLSRGNLVGILGLGHKQSGKYSFEDTSLVESLASQVAISLEKEYLQDELRERQQELSLINRLTRVMTSSLNIQEVYDAFITGLKEVISVDFATVALIEGNELIFSALYTEVGSPWQMGERIPLEGSATEWVLKHKKSIIEPDLAQDKMFLLSADYFQQGIRSIVYLPLITKDEVIGSLVIASCQPNAYTPGQVYLLEQLASQVSTSVANAQLYASAEQRTRIDDLTGLFNRRHFDESLEREVERHSRYGSMFALILLDLDNFKSYNDTKGHLAGDKLLTQAGHLIKRSLRNVDLPFRYGGDEFAIIMPHTSVDDAFQAAERVRAKIAATMINKQITMSTSIGLASWPSDGLRPHDIINAADHALYHAKRTGGNRTCIVSQLMASSTELLESTPTSEKETLNTIYALAATIEARDKYTYGHSRKVRAYAVALAEALGLPPEKVAIVSHAALLHDIGKIGIVDGILNKDGTLDTREWDLIRAHPELSRTIVGHVPSLTPCLPAILHHHERWDGTGYPAGLKGEAIPFEARILSIADAFDAMTSLRPYRAPLSWKKALTELRHGSGSQFDPKLVEAFLPIALTINPEELAVAHEAHSSE